MLPAATTAALQQFAREHQLTLNTLAQAAWAILLHRHSGQDDVISGATVAGRPAQLAGVEQLVGLCINTLPVRARFSRDAALLPWLKQLQHEQIEARQHEHSPLVHVQRWSAVEARQPLFHSLLSFENYPGGSFALDTGLPTLRAAEPRAIERVSYPLNLSVTLGSELALKFIYDRRQFDDSTIDRLAMQMQQLFEQIPLDAGRLLADLPILTAAEQQQLAGWNATARAVPQECLHQLFERHVAQTPDAVALAFGEARLTYGELDRRANQLAHYLQQQGVGPDVLVGLSAERSFEMLIGLLGVLKAGGAFVPLDPTYPQDRLAFMAADAGIGLLLTQQHLLPTWAGATFKQVLCLDRDWPMIAALPSSRPACAATASSLAYVIYTSGSTGRPKGVLVEHADRQPGGRADRAARHRPARPGATVRGAELRRLGLRDRDGALHRGDAAPGQARGSAARPSAVAAAARAGHQRADDRAIGAGGAATRRAARAPAHHRGGRAMPRRAGDALAAGPPLLQRLWADRGHGLVDAGRACRRRPAAQHRRPDPQHAGVPAGCPAAPRTDRQAG